jgi:hypothetical protein
LTSCHGTTGRERGVDAVDVRDGLDVPKGVCVDYCGSFDVVAASTASIATQNYQRAAPGTCCYPKAADVSVPHPRWKS